MDKNTCKLDASLNVETGKIEVNIFDIVRELDDEAKNELGELLAWDTPVADELIRSCVHDFAAENYAPEVLNIRTSILTSEDAPVMLRDWAREMVCQAKTAKAEKTRYDRAYWKLYHAVEDYFGVLKVPSSLKQDYLGKYESQNVTQEEIDTALIGIQEVA